MRRSRAFILALAVVLVATLSVTGAAHAAEVSFGESSADARLGEPLTFRIEFRTAERPDLVELLAHVRGEPGDLVQEAQVEGRAGRFSARVVQEGHTPPNTTILYRWRVSHGGEQRVSPERQVTVTDDRFEWRTLQGTLVRLHWYEGDEEFARRALEIGEEAVAEASRLLGVTESEPVDFFIYGEQRAFATAMGPGTRENVGGQAHSNIRTLFGIIEPQEIDSDWVDVLVVHELTHLVFNTATENLYHAPPRWLNEGLAVYLAEGYTQSWRAPVEAAARNDEIIPLGALAESFPTPSEQFLLAYGESVSAVDHFIRTHGQDTLVELIRSYARGLTDDAAFEAATGAGVDTFNDAWIRAIAADPPEEFGPRPAPTGPVPPGWTTGGGRPDGTNDPAATDDGAATDDAGATGDPGAPMQTATPPAGTDAAPTDGARASSEPAAGDARRTGGSGPDPVAVTAVLAIVALGVVGFLLYRHGQGARRPPTAPPPSTPGPRAPGR